MRWGVYTGLEGIYADAAGSNYSSPGDKSENERRKIGETHSVRKIVSRVWKTDINEKSIASFYEEYTGKKKKCATICRLKSIDNWYWRLNFSDETFFHSLRELDSSVCAREDESVGQRDDSVRSGRDIAVGNDVRQAASWVVLQVWLQEDEIILKLQENSTRDTLWIILSEKSRVV